MKRTRGQAALEYLFTYGWAFLAILLTLGTLAYFGVFDINNLRGETCRFPPGIVCQDYALTDALSGSEELYVELVNNFGVDIDISSMNLTGELLTGSYSCLNETGSLGLWEYEEAQMFVCLFPSDRYISKQTYELLVHIEFSQPGYTYTHTTSGELRVIAQ